MTAQRPPLDIDPETVKGFLHPDEGLALHDAALGVADVGAVLEVGSYCGRSTVWIGTACRSTGNVLFAVDHHRGSEEHQRGEAYHDPDLFDPEAVVMNSFPEFRRTLERAGLNDVVVPVVATSALAARRWSTPLGMVFIDGGHSEAAAFTDLDSWAPHVATGGILAIHDLFERPEDGGQAPWKIYQAALASGGFEALPQVRTLGLLRRSG